MRPVAARRLALAALVAAALAAPAAAAGAECEGDDCQAPPAAPDDPVPATSAVDAPPNPPVRFPKSRPHKHRHRKAQH